MQVLAIASQKGGSGKTTLTGHLAVQAERSGAGPVALLDTDPQGSLAQWWNVRAAETPVFAQSHVMRLREDVARMRSAGINLLIIDTPPAITSMIKEVIFVSNLVVVPVRPSPHDLRAAGATVELVEHLDKSLVFVLNGARLRARISTDAANALRPHGPVAPTIIHQRTDFASSMTDGRTVMELSPTCRSATEIAALWRHLEQCLYLQKHRHDEANDQHSKPPANVVGLTFGRSEARETRVEPLAKVVGQTLHSDEKQDNDTEPPAKMVGVRYLQKAVPL